MAALEKFAEYAADFERSVADDDWGRIKPYFAADAVYEIVAEIYAAKIVGPDAIVAGFKKSLDGFDRVFDTRSVELTGELEVDGDQLSAPWKASYTKEGCDPYVLRGRSTVRYDGDLIASLTDSFDDEAVRELQEWQKNNDLKVDPSYA